MHSVNLLQGDTTAVQDLNDWREALFVQRLSSTRSSGAARDTVDHLINMRSSRTFRVILTGSARSFDIFYIIAE